MRIDNTDFILSTLWSRINPADEYFVWKGMNDFYGILYNGHRFTTENFNAEHAKCLAFIQKSVAESTAKHIIVVAHHLPTMEVVAEQHHGSSLNSAFATELGNYISDSRIDVWIYGHSHTNIRTEINGTKILCNQMGYVVQSEHLLNGFEPGRYIKL